VADVVVVVAAVVVVAWSFVKPSFETYATLLKTYAPP
jgi:hypothetical protein